MTVDHKPSRGAAVDRPAGFPIAAIGASAGGLEALEQLFRNLPVPSGAGFVIVQHLDPTHPSMLAEILQRSTKMPVIEATDQMEVLPDRVHVIPPNRDLTIVDCRLQLSLPAEPRGLRMPIDAFMRSLAEDQGEHAVGIVLSGTGTDGTLGLRAIFGSGGLCLVQEPASAKYDSMPNSAIHAGYASLVLPVEQMPQALRDGLHKRPEPGTTVLAPSAAASSALSQLLAQLRAATGHDFSLYKKTTLGRRIERRMAKHHLDGLEAYAEYTRQHPSELQTLFREMLINVTSFFRDTGAFTALKRKVLPLLLEDKPEGEPLRIWVAGCATGEEVYSVAMVVREWMEETQRDIKVKLYGTDIDDDAIRVARAGLYPPNIAQDLAPERLRHFFNKEDAGYRVKKELREMVVFAVQSVIKDPPFTRLDLLCCRNLLIYLEPELQNRLIPSFHYALKPGGVLFLSPSESIGEHGELFETLDRKWKFYRARATPVSTRRVLADRSSWAATHAAQSPTESADRRSERRLADLAKQALLQSFAPAAVVTDLQGDILYVHGDTGPYLRPAPGQPSHNVVDMACEELQLDLRDALRIAATEGKPSSRRSTLTTTGGERREVSLNVRKLADPDLDPGVLLVSFQAVDDGPPAKPARKSRGKLSADGQRCQELERELTRAKESLRAMLEEQQLSNEELKSTNEELQSTNEELQSTNEELETSKEELQSVNEELVTVNSELQIKIEQMSGMQDDMKNLLDNLRLGTIFLDRNLLIRRFTRDAAKLFPLVGSDVGRPLANIRSSLVDCDLLADAQVVLDSLEPTEREARSVTGQWYLARIQPYRTVDNVVDGVVLTFDDVTDRVNAIAAQESRALAEAIVDAVASPLVVLDARRHVMSANQAFHDQLSGTAKIPVGSSFFEIDARRWDLPAIRELLATPWQSAGAAEARQVDVVLADADTWRVRLGARRIVASPAEREVVLLSLSRIPVDPPTSDGEAKVT
jgi:two-component system CheB/CheR fusion protein